MTPSDIAERLGRSGLCVCPDFLSPDALQQTRADFHAVDAAGGFERAGTGRGAGHELRDGIRRDRTHWLEPQIGNAARAMLFERFDALKTAFNRTLYLGLTSFEGHYASYPEGGFYQRHRDAFADSSKGDSDRMVSLVVYLNEDWRAAHGGSLRVYGEGGQHTDVSPIGGTLVCFMSRESEHEVLPSFAERMSLAGWFRRAAPR